MSYGFCDLGINEWEDKQKLKEILIRLYQEGYKTVAVNQNVDESIFENNKKRKKKTDSHESAFSLVPEPVQIDDLKREFDQKLKILHRITFAFSDPVKTHSLNQLPVLKKYDLYAIIPKTQNAFQFTCSQLNADIILINASSLGLKLNRKMYMQAVERGIHFEIHYSDVIKQCYRKTAIHFSHLFFTFGKSKNVVISSGASDSVFIRNPYDVINLAKLLGLDEQKAKSSILQQAHHLILKGDGRKHGKAFFKIEINSKKINSAKEIKDLLDSKMETDET